MKKEEAIILPVKRVLIELEDGTIKYDGKPDLFTCLINEAGTDKGTIIGFNSVYEENITATMVFEQLKAIEKFQPILALLGLKMVEKELKGAGEND